MVAYCLVDSYDTKAIELNLGHRAVLIGDVACVALPVKQDPKPTDGSGGGEAGKASDESSPDFAAGPPVAFFFAYGACVLWGFTEAEEAEVMQAVQPWEGQKLPQDETDEDRMSFGGAALEPTPPPLAVSALSTLSGLYDKKPEALDLGSRAPSVPPKGAPQQPSHSPPPRVSSTASEYNIRAMGTKIPRTYSAGPEDHASSARRHGISFARSGASFALTDPRDPLAKLSVCTQLHPTAHILVPKTNIVGTPVFFCPVRL
jgi:hypothetical protein